jgi:hypothetical protein
VGSQPPSFISYDAGLSACIRLRALLDPCWRPLALLGMARSIEGFHDPLMAPRLPALLLLSRLPYHHQVTAHQPNMSLLEAADQKKVTSVTEGMQDGWESGAEAEWESMHSTCCWRGC